MHNFSHIFFSKFQIFFKNLPILPANSIAEGARLKAEEANVRPYVFDVDNEYGIQIKFRGVPTLVDGLYLKPPSPDVVQMAK